MLTFKGRAQPDAAGLKARPEVEVDVSDADAAQSLLDALGYVPAFRYQKYREVWDVAGGRDRASTRRRSARSWRSRATGGRIDDGGARPRPHARRVRERVLSRSLPRAGRPRRHGLLTGRAR